MKSISINSVYVIINIRRVTDRQKEQERETEKDSGTNTPIDGQKNTPQVGTEIE